MSADYPSMKIATVGPDGQLMLDRRLLKYLCLKAGDKVELDMWPGARCMIKPLNRPKGMGTALCGLLSGKPRKVYRTLSVEEMNGAIARHRQEPR